MTESIFKHLEKKGIVVSEHQIQPFMSQWDAYKLLTNNSNPEKFATNKASHKHIPVEPKLH
ncbi:hypothetical protein RCG19_13605 [Neobacillus sp. OS1-2]|uniref:hypothetical protein n=1 Tax=Neobacillus sp. OS1-2 TaxID=3070680 RepID=UPI0027E02CA7|nr:hypothetical protein [Neobacillus sp. OS1-2]WML38258.1 hypothetical protein RCG19_13605 [Neobacillus sp. OS1-2]